MGVSKHDVHPLDKYLKFLGSLSLWISIFCASLAAGLAASVYSGDWSWFSRFGNIMVVCGLVLVSSPLFDQGVFLSQARAFGFANTDEDGDTRVTSKESRGTANKILFGIFISFLGTMVAGFGDLLGQVL